jgi:urease accessory protein
MVAVGLWGAFLGPPALYVLPIVFPLIMAFGGAAGVIGLPLGHVETGIALSGVVLGLMVLFAVRLPLWAAAVVVGVFAVFHGYAHGVELPRAAGPLEFGIGFVIATGCLHLMGIALGLLSRWKTGEVFVRAGGAAITAAGVWFLLT